MTKDIKHGLAQNWKQFTLLVAVNAFVGGMVGLERAVLPVLAETEFGIASKLAILSFIASFGLAKALSNLLAGRWADQYGRKKVLVSGWLLGLPVPLLIMWAPSWTWIVAANVLLGMNQGLAWSSTVVMKIDLVGPKQRGLAMGLNESAGYVAVSLAALASGYLAATYAIRPHVFLLGLAFAIVGTLLSIFLVKETKPFADQEAANHPSAVDPVKASFKQIFWLTSWKDKTLFSVSQAGLVNNMNDGMVWGLFPIYFAAVGYSLSEIGLLASLYPAVWGLGQLGTGALSDRVGRKPMIVIGMMMQSVGIAIALLNTSFIGLAASMILLGAGTAFVYPTLLAAIGDVADPAWRATSIGVYRLWRDGGYVVGALVAGVVSDALGVEYAIGSVALLTAMSGGISYFKMEETRVRV